jgi:hypothetical protein
MTEHGITFGTRREISLPVESDLDRFTQRLDLRRYLQFVPLWRVPILSRRDALRLKVGRNCLLYGHRIRPEGVLP